jgi:hypothetical protein
MCPKALIVMDEVLSFLAANLWFVAIVNVTSLVSFAISIWVLIDVRNIKAYYVFKGRVPEHTRNLKRHIAKIANYMNDYEGMLPQIELELVDVEAELESLTKKLDRKFKHFINPTLESIRNFMRAKHRSVDNLRRIQLDLHRIVARIEKLQEDLRWEK